MSIRTRDRITFALMAAGLGVALFGPMLARDAPAWPVLATSASLAAIAASVQLAGRSHRVPGPSRDRPWT